MRYYVKYGKKLEFFKHLVNTCQKEFVQFHWYSNDQVPPAVARVMSEGQRPPEPVLNFYWWLINSPNGLHLSITDLDELLHQAEELGMVIDCANRVYLANSSGHLTREQAQTAPAKDPALISLSELNRRQFGQLVDILRRKYSSSDQFTFPDASPVIDVEEQFEDPPANQMLKRRPIPFHLLTDGEPKSAKDTKTSAKNKATEHKKLKCSACSRKLVNGTCPTLTASVQAFQVARCSSD